MPLDGELSPIAAGPPYLQRHERVRHPMDPESEELLAEAELWIARRVEHRSINATWAHGVQETLRCCMVLAGFSWFSGGFRAVMAWSRWVLAGFRSR